MKLTKVIIEMLQNNIELRLGLALHLKTGEQSVLVNLKRNNINNRLTSVSAISFLMEKTGLKQNELLTKEVVAA